VVAGRSILIHVVGPDGRPMAGVNVHRSVWTRKPGARGNVDRATDERGEARFELPEGMYIFRLWARAEGHVPLFAHWEEEDDPEETLPKEFTFRLERGTVIGGIIRDQDGRAIARATVEVSLDRKGKSEPRVGPDGWLAEGSAASTTDAQGRWTLDNVPAGDDVEVNLKVGHPDYISDPQWGTLQKEQGVTMPALRARTATITMKGGISATGTVTDPEGKPVAGAVVVRGEDPYGEWGSQEVQTDAHGAYRLPPLPRGPLTITVVAQGWMPEQKKIDLQPGPKPVDFSLEPGKELRIRFIDRLGQSIPGVYVSLAKWRGNEALYNHRHPNVLNTQIPNQAGDAGLYQWTWAPADAVTYSFGKEGYDSRDATLVADGKEQTITLQTVLRITGRVTDAATGRPIEKVTAIPVVDYSYGRLRVERQHKKVFPGGVYTIEGDQNRADAAYRVRIEAEGYRTAMSDAVRAGASRPNVDFRLEPAPPVRGRFVDAQGQPVAGARVYLATTSQTLGIENQHEDGWPSNQKVATDGQGAFSFPAQFERYVVIVRHNTAGYAEVSCESDQQPGELALRAWARVEGRLIEAGRPVPSVWIHFAPLRPRSGGSPHIQDGIMVETDRAGHFVFPRVPPVKSSVWAQIAMFRESPIRSSRSVPLDPRPGQRIELDLGGAGISVTGRVVLSGDPALKLDLHQSWNYLIRREPGIEPPAELRSLGFDVRRGWNLTWASASERDDYRKTLHHHHVTLDPNGRFQISGVPAGDYDFAVTLARPPVSGCLASPVSKVVRVRVTEESARKGTLDLGDIPVAAGSVPRPGEVVPELAFTAFSGETVKLSDLRGRYVLLDFWATWCGPCVDALPAVRRLHDTYGADKRLVVLGLNLDDDPGMARRFIEERKLPWTQGALGGLTDNPVLARYAVSSVPAYFLIGPDGKLIRSSHSVEEIAEAVRRLLP
jgi:thiol-disulfide isomerase/thioredoxin